MPKNFYEKSFIADKRNPVRLFLLITELLADFFCFKFGFKAEQNMFLTNSTEVWFAQLYLVHKTVSIKDDHAV